MSVNRCYSEKKNGFDVEARSLFSSLHDLLEIKNLTHVRYLCRYDAEGLAPETYEKAKGIVSPSLWLMCATTRTFPVRKALTPSLR